MPPSRHFFHSVSFLNDEASLCHNLIICQVDNPITVELEFLREGAVKAQANFNLTKQRKKDILVGEVEGKL
jgi:hypothetical protein